MNQCIQGDGGGLFVENNQPDQYRDVSFQTLFLQKTMLIMVQEFILIL